MREVHVINDLQWGSCAKRLFTEWYANEWRPDVIITNGMPNSGGYDSKGEKWSAIPIGYDCTHMISPGAVVNLDDLRREMRNLPVGAKVFIHENAGVVTRQALDGDAKNIRIGSTMTGGTEVSKMKMDRDPEGEGYLAKDYSDHLSVLTTKEWLAMLSGFKKILLLCAQGHGLSINWGFYPYTTSRNTSPAQAIADAGLPPQLVTKIIGCCRPYPIRVSNRFDENGNMIGFSGPSYPNQKELSWHGIGVPAEITSVSKKVRRVFEFSADQIREAVAITGTTDIFMGFINYLPTDKQLGFVNMVDKICAVSYIGHGKTIDEIVKTEKYTWDISWV